MIALFLTALTNGFFTACQTGVLPAERWLCGGAHGDFVCAQLCAVVLVSIRHTVKIVGADFGAVRRGGYHMDTFDVVIDKVMLQNVAETQTREVRDY